MSEDDVLSVDRMDEIMHALFRELKSMGGSANGTDVIKAIGPKLNLNGYEKGTTETGKIRWETHLRFYTSDCVRAGYLAKSDGIWTLTEKGEKVLHLPPGEVVRSAQREYRGMAEKPEASR